MPLGQAEALAEVPAVRAPGLGGHRVSRSRTATAVDREALRHYVSGSQIMTPATLSSRASAYLASLARRDTPTLDEVRRRYDQHGVTLRPVWAAFHHRYAGLVLPLGRASAVLGLVHDGSPWLPAQGFDYETDASGTLVTCADAHPSFDFWLDATGQLLAVGAGGPSSSFEKYLEQRALGAALGADWILDRDTPETEVLALIEHAAPEPTTSDAYSTWFLLDDRVIMDSALSAKQGARRFTCWRKR